MRLVRWVVVGIVLAAGCSDVGPDPAVDPEVLQAVVELGANTHGVDNPSAAEWEDIIVALCAEEVETADLPTLVEQIGLVAPSMTNEVAVSAVRPIWGIACREKLE